MDKKWSVKKICKKIKELEVKHNLFSLEVENVKIWEILRFKLYYKITQNLGLFESAQTYKYNLRKKIILFPRFIKNSIFRNPFFTKKVFNTLLLDHPRKVLKNLEYVDIYTEDLLKNYLRKEDVIILEKAYRGKHWTKVKENIFYTDIIEILSEIFYPFVKISLSKELNKIQSMLDSNDFNINFIKFANSEIKKHIIRKKIYKLLLKRLKIKNVFLVVSYMNLSFIDACKELKIKVTEIQHGTISEYHLGYSYPKEVVEELKLFPDEFFTFGNYWNKYIPLNKNKIIEYGFKEFTNSYRNIKLSKTQIEKKSVLFVSQAVIGSEIFNFAYKLSKINKTLKIRIKLHPSEFDKLDFYRECSKDSKNFEIIETPINGLYDLINQSNTIVGVFSTVIYEALSLGKKVVLINLPGIEYMEDLINQNICQKANDIKELDILLKNSQKIEGEFEWKFF